MNRIIKPNFWSLPPFAFLSSTNVKTEPVTSKKFIGASPGFGGVLYLEKDREGQKRREEREKKRKEKFHMSRTIPSSLSGLQHLATPVDAIQNTYPLNEPSDFN